jgi:hypothetical protein
MARGHTRWVRRVQGARDDASLRPWASGGRRVQVTKERPVLGDYAVTTPL